jgi:hypothetical protein
MKADNNGVRRYVSKSHRAVFKSNWLAVAKNRVADATSTLAVLGAMREDLRKQAKNYSTDRRLGLEP